MFDGPLLPTQDAEHTLTVHLFGRFTISNARQPVTGLQSRRAQELFSYLLLHHGRPYPREALSGLLWEDAKPAQARKYLRQALWQIQTLLQKEMGSAARKLLRVDTDWVQLNDLGLLAVDVADFEKAVEACQGTRGDDLSESQRRDLEQAVQLYRADLLEGCYQDWCLFERERLQNRYLAVLDKLVACCDAHGSIDYGLSYAERILRCDPTEEQAHYHIMHMHWVAGHRTKALRQYRRCEKILQEELGVGPSARTRKLYEEIRADLPEPFAGHDSGPGLKAAKLDDEQRTLLMAYCQQLKTQICSLEEQFRRDIGVVEAGVKKL